ncbi:hypothetical protein [Teichococcus deserti]|nr:hypothetical protein [Pseudoroseomonas deserti]
MKDPLDSVAGACCVAPAMAPQEVDEPVLWALVAALSAVLALGWLA